MIRAFGGKRPRIHPSAFVADGAVVLGDVEIGPEASVWYSCVVRGDIHHISIGPRSNIQDGAVIHTDRGYNPTILEEEVSVGHGAILHGCVIRKGALIGMRAVLLSGCDVGEGAIVGAGAVVPEGMKIPAGKVVIGIPARVRREVREEERARCARTLRNYLDYVKAMKEEGLGQPLEPFAP
jgi:carbonic anhydrase/acetyltransferase-like protein (isoleucine patch superfamily)